MPKRAVAGTKPNIIFIMADDLGFECIGANGGTSYQTPHLDALAGSGIRFTHCYATPLCSPTRVQLMTARYPFRTSWTKLISKRPDDQEFLDVQKEKTFAHMFKDAGYNTVLVGKWQLAHFDEIPDHVKQCGFDRYCCWTWQYDGGKPSRYWNPGIWQEENLLNDTTDKFGPDVFCDYLIDFIREHQDQPFFAYYPMVLTHSPFVRTPDSSENPDAGDQENFADMVAYMDKLVGRIVRTLDELGLRENTVIFFTGDNGTNKKITSVMGGISIQGGKGEFTDAGTHVPLIVNWKGTIRGGRVCDDLIDFSDFMPTLAELSGAALPEGILIDGQSTADVLLEKEAVPREWIFIQLGEKYFIRDKRWKLYHNNNLFDMDIDPSENTPIAPDAVTPESLEARHRLQDALNRLLSASNSVPGNRQRTGSIDGYDLYSNYPNPFNPETNIAFLIANAGNVRLIILNSLGHLVRILLDQYMQAGEHHVAWNGRDDAGNLLGSGLYFCRLECNGFEKTLPMSLVK